jgi:hypothetical protein
MTHSMVLEPAFLEEVEPHERYEGSAEVSPSGFDTPEEVSLSRDAADAIELRFRYPDDEPIGPEESLQERADLAVHIRRGRYSGKIILLRLILPQAATGLPFEVLAERLGAVVGILNQAADGLTRINERLNYRLLSNILDKVGKDLLRLSR